MAQRVGGCLFAFSRGRRKPLYGLLLAVSLATAAVASIEALLRVAPHLFTGMAGNYAYGRYHASAGGIYELDLHMGKRMRPGHVCDMYFNGYRWQHEANVLGFRGPAVERADVVFLGDSLIYGHGVETDQTVPHCFGIRSGLVTANLGVQGTGLIQAWMMLRRTGLQLHPRAVFVCSHPNDTGDVTQYYSLDEVERFLAAGARDDAEPVARPRFRPRNWWNPNEFWDRHLALPLCAAGAIRLLGQGMKINFDWERPVASTPAQLYETAEAVWKPPATEREHLAWQASCLALARIQHDCQTYGTMLVVFDLGFPFLSGSTPRTRMGRK